MAKTFSKIIPERLREAREARGLTTQALAERLNLSRQAVAQFEIGQAAPSAETMGKMFEILNQPPAFFTTPRKLGRETAGTVFWRSLKRMEKPERDRISRRLDWIQDITLYLEEFLDLPPVQLPAPSYRPGDMESVEEAADLVRAQWKLGRGPIPDLMGLVEAAGIIVAREHLQCEDMDAVSCWQCGRPTILLSADKGSAVRSRFDLAHELGHIVLHAGLEIDSKNLAQIEKEADRFAAAFLLPRETFAREIISSSIDSFLPLKKRWKVAIAAMVYRCKDLGLFTPDQVKYLWRQRAIKGWNRHEPLDDEIPPEIPRYLAHSVKLIIDNGVQTKSDFQERLLFCSDDIETLCGMQPGTLNPTVVPLTVRARAT